MGAAAGSGAGLSVAPLSPSFAFQPEHEAITVPDFDVVILNDPLCEMDRVTIVPTNEFFKLDAVAVFRDRTEAILFHARNLNELRETRNLKVGNMRAYSHTARSTQPMKSRCSSLLL